MRRLQDNNLPQVVVPGEEGISHHADSHYGLLKDNDFANLTF